MFGDTFFYVIWPQPSAPHTWKSDPMAPRQTAYIPLCIYMQLPDQLMAGIRLWLHRSHSFLAKVKKKLLRKSIWIPVNVWDGVHSKCGWAVRSCLCMLAKRQHQECQLLETRWEGTASLVVQGPFSLKKALQGKTTGQSRITRSISRPFLTAWQMAFKKCDLLKIAAI